MRNLRFGGILTIDLAAKSRIFRITIHIMKTTDELEQMFSVSAERIAKIDEDATHGILPFLYDVRSSTFSVS